MDKYVRGKVLGKGSFGSAILVTNKVDNKNYVIKEIDISRMPKAEREGAEQEAKLLMALNHPNIVRCLECFTHLNKLCIVMDWCSEGDLYGLIQKRRGQQLNEDTIIDWLVQMCLGLKHVHDRKILHRDIKTQNVFMSTGGLLKLGDFGVSKVLNSTFQLATTAVGTPYYLSPEICQNRKYNQKSDIWSLGCVLYEMATLKHAFEGPNMRALISKIIKGSYTPMPSTRSRELRELCDRMLTLDWQKRPSINDILNTPIMKARIQKFLSATLQAHEFSHTIIHGRPKPGHLVVGGPAAAAGAGQGPLKLGAAAVPLPTGASPASARSSVVSAAGAGRAGSAAGAVRQSGASPNLMPRPGSGAAAAGSGAHRPGAAPPPRPAVAASALGGPGAAALRQAQEAAAAARAKAAEAVKQREEVIMALAAKRASDAKVNAKRELERAKAREVAAMGAQREIERLRLEEQRRKLEEEKARLEAERKKREVAKTEEERRAKATEEARLRLKEEEARRQREMEANRKRAQEDGRKKDSERAAKDKGREDMRAQIAVQRKEYQDRQAEAARNRAAVEQQLGHVGGQPEVQVLAGRPPRRQWSPPRAEEAGCGRDVADEEGPRGGAAAAAKPAAGRRGQDDYLSAEQRRAVWEEQRAAAQRNRRAVHDERHGGIAEFLGVPMDDADGATQVAAPAACLPSPSKPAGGEGISPDARRAAYLEMHAAAKRNRAAVQNADRGGTPTGRQSGHGAGPPGLQGAGRAVSPLGQGAARVMTPPVPHPTDPWAAKMARLEEERRKREQEILEFQRQHWQEVREARERNKRQIMAEVRGSPQAAPPISPPENSGARAPSPGNGFGRAPKQPLPAAAVAAAAPGVCTPAARGASGADTAADEEDDMDFAAMVKDMQDVLLQDGTGEADGRGDEEEDDIYNDDVHNAALSGQFMLNGLVVELSGVRKDDSLALKVEALRVFLEEKLGTEAFLKVYRLLESLSLDDDEAAVSAQFLAILGQEKLPYLNLVHQLIVCEENMR